MNQLKILLFLILPGVFINVQAQNDFFDRADQFFQGYTEDGKVIYELVKEDPTLLNELLDEIKNFPLTDQNSEAKKAFYINAYNLIVIKEIVKHYPVKSPLDIPGLFDKKKHEVAGQLLTLNELERDVLFNEFFDPRLHFVLVCGANGCPPLPGQAFRPENTESLLQEATVEALNDPSYIRIDQEKRVVRLPMIFDWYKKDFEQESGSVISYINKYRENRIPESFKIEFYPYDWSLNDKKKAN